MTDHQPHAVHQTPVSRLLRGQVDVRESLAKLQLYRNDTVELCDDTVSIPLERGLMIGVILEGQLDISLANTHHAISATAGPIVFAIQVRENTTLIRHLKAGNRVRRLHIWLPAVELGRLLTPADRQHLPAHGHITTAQASSAVVTQTRECLEAKKAHTTPAAVAADALRLVSECLQVLSPKALAGAGQQPQQLPEKQRRQARRLEAYLNTQTNLSDSRHLLRDMSAALGLSVSSLQRLSQRLYGTTIKDHLRQRHLNAARDALLNGASIGEAAYIAGYRHTSNFSAAFKRAFDAPPGAFQNDCQSA